MKSAKHVQKLQKLIQIQRLKLPKYQKRYIIKEKVIETIQKIYDRLSGTFLRQGLKMREWPKSSFGFFRGVYCGELSPKFQMYN